MAVRTQQSWRWFAPGLADEGEVRRGAPL